MAEALAYVWSENFTRRHLDPGQAAIAEAKRAKFCDEYAVQVEGMKAESLGRGQLDRDGKGKIKPLGKQISPTAKESHKTTAVRARAVGTNRRYLEAAVDLLETAPEKLEPVDLVRAMCDSGDHHGLDDDLLLDGLDHQPGRPYKRSGVFMRPTSSTARLGRPSDKPTKKSRGRSTGVAPSHSLPMGHKESLA